MPCSCRASKCNCVSASPPGIPGTKKHAEICPSSAVRRFPHATMSANTFPTPPPSPPSLFQVTLHLRAHWWRARRRSFSRGANDRRSFNDFILCLCVEEPLGRFEPCRFVLHYLSVKRAEKGKRQLNQPQRKLDPLDGVFDNTQSQRHHLICPQSFGPLPAEF